MSSLEEPEEESEECWPHQRCCVVTKVSEVQGDHYAKVVANFFYINVMCHVVSDQRCDITIRELETFAADVTTKNKNEVKTLQKLDNKRAKTDRVAVCGRMPEPSYVAGATGRRCGVAEALAPLSFLTSTLELDESEAYITSANKIRRPSIKTGIRTK